jgi:hypothetical protein
MTRYMNPEVDLPEWVEASPEDPCPVCGAIDGCKVSEDRTFACCMNVIYDPLGAYSEWPVVTGGWLHRLHMVE